jgi:hypothetical protein
MKDNDLVVYREKHTYKHELTQTIDYLCELICE